VTPQPLCASMSTPNPLDPPDDHWAACARRATSHDPSVKRFVVIWRAAWPRESHHVVRCSVRGPVLPNSKRRLLAGHDIILLDEAASQVADHSLVVELLDECSPSSRASDVRDDPFNPSRPSPLISCARGATRRQSVGSSKSALAESWLRPTLPWPISSAKWTPSKVAGGLYLDDPRRSVTALVPSPIGASFDQRVAGSLRADPSGTS